MLAEHISDDAVEWKIRVICAASLASGDLQFRLSNRRRLNRD
jgi:hypothetical protein